jgi:hypothetical protein
MSTEFIIILILFAYIAILHIQLNKKTNLIEKLISKQNLLDSELSSDSITLLLKKLQKEKVEKPSPPNKLFDEDILRFIVGDINKQLIYIHYTKEESVAQRILVEGFRFIDTFYKTAEPVTNDKLDLIYKHYLHKYFGKFVILIGISKEVYNKYLKMISLSKKLINVEQIISKKSPNLDENQDEVYFLPPQFVKGYINSETGEIIDNLGFDPYFDPPYAIANAEEML